MENRPPPSSSGGSGARRMTPNDFYFGKLLGEGSFSCVYLAKEVRTAKKYAIKVCEKRLILREKKQEYVKREREVLNRLSSRPGFLGLYCTFQDRSRLYFVMTYACNGTLLSLLSRPSFTLDCARFYAAEILLALETMHDLGILHRDIKPENILLDQHMHVLMADFGSSKLDYQEEVEQPKNEEQPEAASASASKPNDAPPSPTMSSARKHAEQVLGKSMEKANNEEDNDSGTDTDDRHPSSRAAKRRSFVGTAQYVSPEILTGTPSSPASDLWSYACTIYQMVCGVPPFRAASEYLIFQKILRCQVNYGEGFDPTAKDLVTRLLQIEQCKRLGAHDQPRYCTLRAHPFFRGIQFDQLRSTPAPIPPTEDTVLHGETAANVANSYFPEGMKPGLDDRQLTRLLDFKLASVGVSDDDDDDDDTDGGGSRSGSVGSGRAASAARTGVAAGTVAPMKFTKSFTDGTSIDGSKHDTATLAMWEPFAEGEKILKLGYVHKRKGLFARRRLFLLTTGPRLIYIDPVNMVKKGEIPWTRELSVEAKNFKTFYVHTPNRTYYLEDPEGFALKWCDCINEVHRKAFLNSLETNGRT